MSTFIQALTEAWRRNDSLVCVGLDPEIERLPRHLAAGAAPIFQFNKAVIDATADLVCAYKPQFAHYAACEAEDQLERTIEYIHKTHPGVPVILDSKRGDVGNTAERYAIEGFERYGADAVTVNPYLGSDSLEPYLRRADKGVIILCRTSNPGAVDLQDLLVDGRPLYQVVAPRNAGTRAAIVFWLSVRPTRVSLHRCARWWATWRCWCREWARREAMSPRSCKTARPQTAPASSSAPRAASCTPRKARTSRAQRAAPPKSWSNASQKSCCPRAS